VKRDDEGFTLVEVVVTIALVAILAPAIAGLMVTMIRTLDATQRSAERLAVAVSATSVAQRVVLVDECDGPSYNAPIGARIAVRATWTLDVVPDCTEAPTVLTVTVADDRGGVTELVGVRP
jgi:prepilin-type N-terminal cleavage/methylation domain-containing protein